jgi:hypothetical protein
MQLQDRMPTGGLLVAVQFDINELPCFGWSQLPC